MRQILAIGLILFAVNGAEAQTTYSDTLRHLSRKYAETSDHIKELTINCRYHLAQKGVEESNLNIMKGMNQVLDRPIFNRSGEVTSSYTDYLAFYMVQRIDNRKNHAGAIQAMRELLHTFKVQ